MLSVNAGVGKLVYDARMKNPVYLHDARMKSLVHLLPTLHA